MSQATALERGFVKETITLAKDPQRVSATDRPRRDRSQLLRGPGLGDPQTLSVLDPLPKCLLVARRRGQEPLRLLHHDLEHVATFIRRYRT